MCYLHNIHICSVIKKKVFHIRNSGPLITDQDSSKEIRVKTIIVGQAWAVFNNIWGSTKRSQKTKLKILKSNVSSVITIPGSDAGKLCRQLHILLVPSKPRVYIRSKKCSGHKK